MPLPQAKPDKRIYELLKNVDLENLTFADLQAVGQKIFAEQGAEDELRRLVLVNLARLSVAGEWNGLTTGGGGGSFSPVIPQVGSITSTNRYQLWGNIPYNGANLTANQTLTDFDKPRAYPFVAPATGNISEVGMGVAKASQNTLQHESERRGRQGTTSTTEVETTAVADPWQQGQDPWRGYLISRAPSKRQRPGSTTKSYRDYY